MLVKLSFLLFVAITHAYNIDIDHPIVYYHPKNESYFGHTVLLYSNREANSTWLLVGAPRGNYSQYIADAKANPIKPGVTYRCTINAKCKEIKPKRIEDEDGYIAQIGMKMRIEKRNGWFGSAMSVDKRSGLLTVCAPRTIVRIFYPMINQVMSTMQGMCYSGDVSSDRLAIEEEDVASYDFRSMFWYNPIYGFSIHYGRLLTNGTTHEQNEISRIIGEPGYDLDGSVKVQNLNKIISVVLPVNGEQSHFGYSVTSGVFFKKDQLLYASGAPRWQYVGLVVIINPLTTPSIVGKLRGTDAGEYFGTSLAAGDLNNDGFDDLIVGAPHWGHDNGKVYLYFGNSKGQFETAAFLQGAVEDGQFGYAVTCGDLDTDKYDDIIVGAPWEGRGVIYVYSGGKDLQQQNLKPSQRIAAMEVPKFSSELTRFGFSLSEPIDIDENGIPDVAIGAYKSGRAVLLRSRPVVETKITLELIPNILQRDTKQFLIQICREYAASTALLSAIAAHVASGKHLELVGDYKISLVIDERYQRTEQTFLKLWANNSACVQSNVTISDNVQDFIEPLTIFASHEFTCDNLQQFSKFCPMELRANKLNVAQTLLPFDIGCGEDVVCNANISATTRFYGVRDNDTWVIGSSDISLEVELQNYGELAYLTSLVFSFPEKVVLRSILPFCQEDPSEEGLIVTCDAGNPIGEGEQKKIKLNLDMRHLIHGSYHGRTLNFLTTIKTRSTNHGTQNITSALHLISEVSLSLNGKATDNSYHLSVSNNDALNVSFQHTYQVYKLGATPVEDAQLVVQIPTALNSETIVELYEPRFYVSGKLYTCSSKEIEFLDTQTIDISEPPPEDFDLYGFQKIRENRSRKSRAISESGNMTMFENDYDTTNEDMQEFYDTRNSVSEAGGSTIDIYLNCSTPGVNCSTIVCDLSALETLQDVGKFVIKFLLDVEKLKDSFNEDKNVLKFSTEARVEILKPVTRLSINGTRSTLEVVTLFYNTPQPQELQSWIILVSVSLGLLLLLIFAIILSKLGFFKRSMKQDLTPLESNEAETKQATSKT